MSLTERINARKPQPVEKVERIGNRRPVWVQRKDAGLLDAKALDYTNGAYVPVGSDGAA